MAGHCVDPRVEVCCCPVLVAQEDLAAHVFDEDSSVLEVHRDHGLEHGFGPADRLWVGHALGTKLCALADNGQDHVAHGLVGAVDVDGKQARVGVDSVHGVGRVEPVVPRQHGLVEPRVHSLSWPACRKGRASSQEHVEDGKVDHVWVVPPCPLKPKHDVGVLVRVRPDVGRVHSQPARVVCRRTSVVDLSACLCCRLGDVCKRRVCHHRHQLHMRHPDSCQHHLFPHQMRRPKPFHHLQIQVSNHVLRGVCGCAQPGPAKRDFLRDLAGQPVKLDALCFRIQPHIRLDLAPPVVSFPPAGNPISPDALSQQTHIPLLHAVSLQTLKGVGQHVSPALCTQHHRVLLCLEDQRRMVADVAPCPGSPLQRMHCAHLALPLVPRPHVHIQAKAGRRRCRVGVPRDHTDPIRQRRHRRCSPKVIRRHDRREGRCLCPRQRRGEDMLCFSARQMGLLVLLAPRSRTRTRRPLGIHQMRFVGGEW